ncbi:MAG: YHS domain-containing (seleno)protein [Paracoccaceae bacterium]
MRRLIIALFAVIGLTGPAAADPIAIGGYDAVSYQNGAPVAGSPAYSLDWRGRSWQFASADTKAEFQADPERYAPEFGGHCAYAASRGYIAAGDPEIYRLVDGKLYLQFSRRALELWEEDVPGNIAKGEANWPKIRPN